MLNLQKDSNANHFFNETFNGGRFVESEEVALEIYHVPKFEKFRGPKP